MPTTIQVGTVLINDSPLITRYYGLESEACSGSWSIVKSLDGFGLDRKIHAAGWNFYFIAGGVKETILGAGVAKKIENALGRILGKVQQQHFNVLDVTGIVEQ